MTPPPSDQQRDLEGLREAVTLHEDYERIDRIEAALERAARVEEATRAYIQARRDRLPTRWPELLAALDALAPPQEGASG